MGCAVRVHVVTVGRNCEPFALRCLESLAEQTRQNVTVTVVDDASTDGTSDIVAGFCDGRPGWQWQVNSEPVGATRNQYEAWQSADLDDGDVVAWCDLDDALASPDALARLAAAYKRRNVWMTYGNYRPVHSHAGPCDDRCSCWTCPNVAPYPSRVMHTGKLRSFIRAGGGFRFNHLRAVTWRLLRRVDVDDLRDDDGNWWTSGPDAAVMLPCLEMAGPRYRVLADVLVNYTADNPASEWRTIVDTVRSNHRQMLSRPPKRMLAQ